MSDCSACAARGACPSANDDGVCPSGDVEKQQEAAKQIFEKIPPADGAAIKYVVAVASGKGGVGKSLVTSLLAVQLSRIGLKVGILDADMTGPSIPQAFGVQDQMATAATDKLLAPVKTKGGIQLMSINVLLEDPNAPVVWRGPIIATVVKQFWQDVLWEDVDVLLVDMPPGTGDVPLTVFQSLPLNGLVMVATPQELVTMIVNKAKRMADSMNVPLLGLIENMSYFVCDGCGKKHHLFGDGKCQEAAAAMGIQLLEELPMEPDFAKLVDAGQIEELRSTVLGDTAMRLWMRLSGAGKPQLNT